jgi:Fic family protein
MYADIPLQILPARYFPAYAEHTAGMDWNGLLENVPQVDITSDTFGFYASVASVFSSKIEGEPIELDSYLRHRFLQGRYKPDYTRKVDELYAAYQFAREHPLTLKNVLKAQSMLTRSMLPTERRGKIRRGHEIIVNAAGQIEYTAADASIVKTETEKLFADIALLLQNPLAPEESFYAASMIHLVFLKIHPFEDGNGRTARLLEKWFLAEKFGEPAWYIPSERFYFENLNDYYRNVHIGQDYESLQFDRCLPLLLMLPAALSAKPR